MTEAALLSLVGGVIGGALAYVGFNGYQTATMNWQTFSQVAFAFAVTPSLLVQASSTPSSWDWSAGFCRPSAPPGCRS